MRLLRNGFLTVAVLAALVWAVALAGPASAQSRAGVYAPGQAAVTGFSGAVRPSEIAPGQDPDTRTFIDPEGPSLRVVDVSRMGGPPRAQLVDAQKPFTVSAKWIGQVFGVALDDASPANIYVAATSAYGLAIAAPGLDGRLQHVRRGAKGAVFMPAQWGPNGGPGSIWKIDGASGRVTLFANVLTGGRANSGAALGGLAYDPASKSLFVADRETGLIHRFGANGADLGVYDPAAGPSPGTATPRPGVDIASADFDSARPETWGYAPPERRVFAVAVHEGRLYYAIAEGLRVWSVSLKPDGGFGADARIELAPPPAAGATEISKIVFDDQGRIYLAERPAPTGAQDFEALAVPSIGRVLRYAVIGVTETKQPIWQPLPDEYAVGFSASFRNDNGGVAIGYDYDGAGRFDPRSCGGFLWTTGEQLRKADDPKLAATLGPKDAVNGLQGHPVWRIRRDDEPPRISYFVEYSDGPLDPQSHGRLGDVAIQRACAEQPAQLPPNLFPEGRLPPPATFAGKPPSPSVCRNFVCGPGGGPCPLNHVWSFAAGACKSGCELTEILVNGKCCSAKDLEPGGACASGCAPPDVMVNGKCCAPKDLQPGGVCASDCAPPNVMVNGKCCSPQDLAPGGACAKGGPTTQTEQPMCGVTQTAIGPDKTCCDNDHIYSDPKGDQLCCATPLVNGKCGQPLIPKIPIFTCPDCCAAGYVKTGGACCLKSQTTSTGTCCPLGQTPSADGKTCEPFHWLPLHPLCCAAGYVPAAGGKCCAPANLTSSGACCSATVDPNNRQACPTEVKKTSIPPKACGPGEVRGAAGVCAPVVHRPVLTPIVPRRPNPPPVCARDERRDASGACVKRRPHYTPPPAEPTTTPELPETPTFEVPGIVPPPHIGGLRCPPGTRPGPMGMRCLPVGRGQFGFPPPRPPTGAAPIPGRGQ